MFKRIAVICTLLTVALLLIYGCSKDEQIQVNKGLAARVGDVKISEKKVDIKFDRLPPNEQDKYKGLEGRVKFVKAIIDEQIMYQEAIERKIHLIDDVEEILEQNRINSLLAEYYKREIIDKIEIGEEESRSYYDENHEQFITKALMKAQHIFSEDRAKCEKWKKRLDGGESFNKIAKEESEDLVTGPNLGNLGYFNPDGYINWVGYSDKFGTAVEKYEPGEITDIIEFEKGFSIVKINEKVPARLQEFSEVEVRILEKLRGQRAKEAYDAMLIKLRKKYKPINYVREQMLKATRSPEQLWEMAQMENDPNDRIRFYAEIARRYENHKYAPMALFMVGFVYAEDLQDLTWAHRNFQAVIDKYPDNEIAKSAQWMIDNLYKKHPRLDSFKSMQKAMEQEETGNQ